MASQPGSLSSAASDSLQLCICRAQACMPVHMGESNSSAKASRNDTADGPED